MIKKTLIYIPWVILVSLGLYFIITTSPYVRYWVDDFCSAAFLRDNGFWGAQVGWWKSWTGRYSYIFFLDVFESVGPWVVRVLPILLLVFLIISLRKILFGKLVFASLFAILALINSPNIIQSFYWQTGSLNYTIPFIFLNFSLWFVFGKKSRVSYFFPFVFAFIAGGFSEAFAISALVLLVFIFFAVFVVKPKNKNYQLKSIAAAIAGMIASLIVMSLSPGNIARGLSVTKPESLFYVVKWTVLTTKWYLLRMFSIDTFLYSSGILLFASFLFAKGKKINIKKGLLIMLMSITALVLTTAAVIGSGFYSMSIIPPERTLFIVFYEALLCLFAFFYSFCLILNKYIRKKMWNYLLTAVIFLNVVLSTLLGISTFKHWSKVRTEVFSYAKSWDNEVGNLPKIHNIKPVGELDSFTDNKGWVASCIARYYNIENIKISP